MSWRSLIILILILTLASSALMLTRSLPLDVKNEEPSEPSDDVTDLPGSDDEPTEEGFKNTGKTYDEEFKTLLSFDHLSSLDTESLSFTGILSNDFSKTEYSYVPIEHSGSFVNSHFNVDLNERSEDVYSLKFKMLFNGSENSFSIFLKQPGYLDKKLTASISTSYIDLLRSNGMRFDEDVYTILSFELILDYIV